MPILALIVIGSVAVIYSLNVVIGLLLSAIGFICLLLATISIVVIGASMYRQDEKDYLQ